MVVKECKAEVTASGQISSREGKEGGNEGGKRRERWVAWSKEVVSL